MKKLVAISSKEALEIRRSLLLYIKEQSRYAHSQSCSSEASSKALDCIDICESFINKLNRKFFN